MLCHRVHVADAPLGYTDAAPASAAAALPTVSSVLDLPALRRGRPRVVAGRAGLSNVVRWAHVTELPDIASMLRGGELLLTTGVAFPDSDADLAVLIERLAAVGSAALVVELGRRWTDELPLAMRQAADEHALPLVELRREIPFVEVTEAVHARVADAQLAQLRASEQLHRTFNELTVEGAGIAEVMRQTARVARTPIVLENLTHQVLAFDAAGGSPEELLDRWEARSRSTHGQGRTWYDAERGWLVTTVGARGVDWGRLVLVTSAPPDQHAVALVERAATALALHRLVQKDRDSVERQSHRTVLTGILRHDVPSSELAAAAQALGVPVEGSTLVGVIVRPRDLPGADPVRSHEALAGIAEEAAAVLRTHHVSALVAAIDDVQVAVLLTLREESAVDGALQRFGSDLSARYLTTTPGSADAQPLVVAAGAPVSDLLTARRSLLEASQVAQAVHDSSDATTSASVYQLPDVRLRGLLHLLRDDVRVQTFVERELGGLLRWDAEHQDDLVGVLRIYLETGRNKSVAAQRAGLSRQGFYERLQKIERVALVDLSDTESCVSLHVALLALDAVRAPSLR